MRRRREGGAPASLSAKTLDSPLHGNDERMKTGRISVPFSLTEQKKLFGFRQARPLIEKDLPDAGALGINRRIA